MVRRRLVELHGEIRRQGESLEVNRERAAAAIARSWRALACAAATRAVIEEAFAKYGLAAPRPAAARRVKTLARLAVAQACRLGDAVEEARRVRAACVAARTGRAAR